MKSCPYHTHPVNVDDLRACYIPIGITQSQQMLNTFREHYPEPVFFWERLLLDDITKEAQEKHKGSDT